VAVLALLFTLLNCPKPIHIDDPFYLSYAGQIARHPLDPYDFEMLWDQTPMPTLRDWTPMVMPYWLALGMRLLGEDPIVCKLWMLPWNLVFVWSVAALLRRFAGSYTTPLLWATVLSPTFLPTLNLMIDTPSVALRLAALVLLLRSCDRSSWAMALVAGLLAGLATQTKYTAFVGPPLLLICGQWYGKPRWGVLACATAAVIFVAWEGGVLLRHGESHFLSALRSYHANLPGSDQSPWLKLAVLFRALFTHLGGVAPGLLLCGLASLGLSRRRAVAAALLVASGFVLVALVPELNLLAASESGRRLAVNLLVFRSFGIGLCAVLAVVCFRLGRRTGADWETWFLFLWLGLEVAGYLILTPFPAARRCMGVVVVSTLIVGRLAVRTCRSPDRAGLIRALALSSIPLGLLFYGVDLCEALAARKAAEVAAAEIEARQPGATAWYAGRWGFQYYAEQAGMKPLVFDRSRLRKGDWLAVPNDEHYRQLLQLEREPVQPVAEILVDDLIPLRTVPSFYGGRFPLEHRVGPRLSVTLYRVVEDYTPVRRAPEPAMH
jgi:hypothetical protein